MGFSNEEVQKIAKLARLKVSEEEVQEYGEQLSSILEYVEKLQELETDSVPEMQHAAGETNVFRVDEVEGCESAVRDRAIERFPRREGNLLAVQAVFEERTE